ncbi:hypothetical protein BH11CYA1_BH11CYA1_14000 [soil metagenome]
MFIQSVLQNIGWFLGACATVSFIEHQVHARLMHQKNFLSKYTSSFKRVYEAHAIVHHAHYSKIFTDEPVAPGEDKEIRLTVHKAPIKTLPLILLISLVSIPGALIFAFVVVMHHWIWNKIHLEMHKPEARGFSKWPAYKFLARHHYLHHVYPNKNYNVVFPFADYVTGTNVRANQSEMLEMYEHDLLDLNPAQVASLKEAAAQEKQDKLARQEKQLASLRS